MCFLLFPCVAAQPYYCTIMVGCMIVWDRKHWNVCMYTMKTCTHSLSLTHTLSHTLTVLTFKIKSSHLRSNIDLLPIFKIFSPMFCNHGDRYYCQTSVLLHSDLNTKIYSRWPSGFKKIRGNTRSHTTTHIHMHTAFFSVCVSPHSPCVHIVILHVYISNNVYVFILCGMRWLWDNRGRRARWLCETDTACLSEQ